jgi:DNA-binding winged helix-turn-helix (wHTH) protein
VATRKGGKSYGHSALQVGRWQVQPTLNQVRDGSTVRHLEPQVMDLLVFLASHEDRVVSKDEIIEGVWEGRFIAEATLTRSIADLRRALGDNRQQPQYIETIAKRGYRLVAGVSGLDRRAEWPAQTDAAGSRPILSSEPCLVVLPLTNLGLESDQYFCDGLTEEIINTLTRLAGLRVISRISAL